MSEKYSQFMTWMEEFDFDGFTAPEEGAEQYEEDRFQRDFAAWREDQARDGVPAEFQTEEDYVNTLIPDDLLEG